MDDTSPEQRRHAVRTAMRQQLAALSAPERAERSRRLVARIQEMPAWRGAARVLLFAPLPTEPDVDLLWSNGASLGKLCAYPRVRGQTLGLYYIDGLAELESTRWGLREPPVRPSRAATLAECGVVLVPGLAFDAAGGRLGRGGGFYDRLLAARDPAKTRLVGIGFAFQLVEGTLPLAPHDVRLDEVVTG